MVETNRGDITYHDLHWLLRSYEEIFIRLLKDYEIDTRRINGLTGVWVGNEKITAIGVAVRHWISYHGFAFNINPDLEHFPYIIPCGIKDRGVTSLHAAESLT